MTDKPDLDELARKFMALARMVTLRQAVDAGIHEQLGWDAYALNEGADPDWRALRSYHADEIEASLVAAAREVEVLRGEVTRLRGHLANINRKASPDPERTMSEASNDLYWCACEARAALGEDGDGYY